MAINPTQSARPAAGPVFDPMDVDQGEQVNASAWKAFQDTINLANEQIGDAYAIVKDRTNYTGTGSLRAKPLQLLTHKITVIGNVTFSEIKANMQVLKSHYDRSTHDVNKNAVNTMYNNPKFSDLKITVQNEKGESCFIYVSKNYVHAACPEFYQMLLESPKVVPEGEPNNIKEGVVITHPNLEAMKSVVESLFHTNIEITKETYHDIYELAKKFNLKKLSNDCLNFFQRIFNSLPCSVALEAKGEFKVRAGAFFSQNHALLLSDDAKNRMPFSYFQSFLALDGLEWSEFQVAQVIMAHKDRFTEEQFLELKKLIRLETIAPSEFFEILSVFPTLLTEEDKDGCLARIVNPPKVILNGRQRRVRKNSCTISDFKILPPFDPQDTRPLYRMSWYLPVGTISSDAGAGLLLSPKVTHIYQYEKQPVNYFLIKKPHEVIFGTIPNRDGDLPKMNHVMFSIAHRSDNTKNITIFNNTEGCLVGYLSKNQSFGSIPLKDFEPILDPTNGFVKEGRIEVQIQIIGE